MRLQRTHSAWRWSGLIACLMLAGLSPLAARPTTGALAVPGIEEVHLSAQHWIARLPDPDRIVLDRAGIDAQNARMRAEDPSIHDLRALPADLPAAMVREAIARLSAPPSRTLYDADGAVFSAERLQALDDALALDQVPASRPLALGLVVQRAALRAFPTRERAFSAIGDTDIDRFQESALFPGDAVAVLHASRDGQWLFVASQRYLAWIEADAVAIGGRDQVLGYGAKAPFRIVTGATVATTFTPEQPQVSRLQLDMGVRVPVLADWPADQPVNGQHPYASHVIELPIRDRQGRLQVVPALLPKTADTAADYLPLTPRNLLLQSFKFLGERYGWGHDYDTRDCSGFVSEIYRSFGVLLPRNTSAQAVSPALDRLALKDADAAARAAALADLQVGDLIYIPGHVMMAIGHENGLSYVIHDTAGGGWLGDDGVRVQGKLNGVAVTPLEPLLFNDTATYVERITSIQRIRPAATP